LLNNEILRPNPLNSNFQYFHAKLTSFADGTSLKTGRGALENRKIFKIKKLNSPEWISFGVLNTLKDKRGPLIKDGELLKIVRFSK